LDLSQYDNSQYKCVPKHRCWPTLSWQYLMHN
jgi:hypothetical protein